MLECDTEACQWSYPDVSILAIQTLKESRSIVVQHLWKKSSDICIQICNEVSNWNLTRATNTHLILYLLSYCNIKYLIYYFMPFHKLWRWSKLSDSHIKADFYCISGYETYFKVYSYQSWVKKWRPFWSYHQWTFLFLITEPLDSLPVMYMIQKWNTCFSFQCLEIHQLFFNACFMWILDKTSKTSLNPL